MEEIRCLECGKILTKGMIECPQCGCPVQSEVPAESSSKVDEVSKEISSIEKKAPDVRKNIMPYISLLLGVIIFVMGIFVATKKADVETYSARNYDVAYAAFGADFYTEIYGASDTIADELNDINGGIEYLSNAICSVINVIYFSAGIITIALGLATIAVSCIKIKKEN